MMTKVTLSLDEHLVQDIRRRALARRGNLRSLSKEIESVLLNSDALAQMDRGFRGICCDGKRPHFGPGGFRPLRFKNSPPAHVVLRQMRKHRAR